MSEFLNLVTLEEVAAVADGGKWKVTCMVKGDITKEHKGKEVVVKGDVVQDVGTFSDAEFRSQFVPIDKDAIDSLVAFEVPTEKKAPAKKKVSKK